MLFRSHTASNLGSTRYAITPQDARRAVDPARYTRRRLAYRDVASATNRLTLIATILPAGCLSTHTLFCLRTPVPLRHQYYLCGLFNSFVLNYFVRMRISTHVTTAIIESLPVPRPDEWPRACREISALSRLVAHRDDRPSAARLQALVAALYQLSLVEYEHVLTTFPLVPSPEREAALHAFAAIAR